MRFAGLGVRFGVCGFEFAVCGVCGLGVQFGCAVWVCGLGVRFWVCGFGGAVCGDMLPSPGNRTGIGGRHFSRTMNDP